MLINCPKCRGAKKMMGMGCVYVNCPECRGAGKVIKKEEAIPFVGITESKPVESEVIEKQKSELNMNEVELEIKNILNPEKEKANDEIISEEIKFEEPEIKKSKIKKVGK